MSAARVALVRGSDLDVLLDGKPVVELFGRGRSCGWADTGVEALEPVCRASEATAGVRVVLPVASPTSDRGGSSGCDTEPRRRRRLAPGFASSWLWGDWWWTRELTGCRGGVVGIAARETGGANAGVGAGGIDCAAVTGVACGALPLWGSSSGSEELGKDNGVDRVRLPRRPH